MLDQPPSSKNVLNTFSEPVNKFKAALQLQHDLLVFSRYGMEVVTKPPFKLKFVQGKLNTTTSTKLVGTIISTDLARKEVEAGFPTLHGQSLISVWAYLESTIRDLLVLWIKMMPESMNTEAVQKITDLCKTG